MEPTHKLREPDKERTREYTWYESGEPSTVEKTAHGLPQKVTLLEASVDNSKVRVKVHRQKDPCGVWSYVGPEEIWLSRTEFEARYIKAR